MKARRVTEIQLHIRIQFYRASKVHCAFVVGLKGQTEISVADPAIKTVVTIRMEVLSSHAYCCSPLHTTLTHSYQLPYAPLS
jgi:hypothetical protein